MYDICLNAFHNFVLNRFHNDIFPIPQPLKKIRFMQLLRIEVCRKILKDVWGETGQLTYKISSGAMVAIGSKPFISFERMYDTKRTHNMLCLMSNLHYQSLFPWLFICWVGPRCLLNLFLSILLGCYWNICMLLSRVDPSFITKNLVINVGIWMFLRWQLTRMKWGKEIIN